MGIRVEHGKPSTVIKAARQAGEARAGKEIAKQAMANAARLQERQMAQEYDMALKKQDMAIDLQMNERAKLWQIEKMELASRLDFQREEQARQRKLDSADNALQQIDKEVLAGRMTEQEARPLKLKYEMNKLGVDVPTSLLPTGDDEEEKYGVQPYWMRGRDAPEGSPERQLYESKMEQGISGERKGTVPYYLDPEWLRDNRDIAMQVLDSKGVILEEEEIDALISGAEGDKSLGMGVRPDGTQKGTGHLGILKLKGGGIATEYSVGVRLEANRGRETDIPSLVPTLTEKEIDLMVNDIIPNKKPVPQKILQKAVDHANKRVRQGLSPFRETKETEVATGDGRVRVISPEGQTGTILESELSEYIDKGFEVVGEAPGEPTKTPLPETSEDVVERLEAGKAKFRKPSLRTFATMSPLRTLMERRKAKKIVR